MPSPAPAKRPRRRALPRLDHCLNCGHPTGDNFCPHCGQENHDQTVALGLFLREMLSEVASWDSKILRTLLPLLFRPGFLTNEYNAGRRIRYLSPLKMYLAASALFFLVAAGQTPASRLSPGDVRDLRQSGHAHLVWGGAHLDVADLPRTVAEFDAQQRRPGQRLPFPLRVLARQFVKAREDPQQFLQDVNRQFVNDAPKAEFFLLPVFALLLKLTYRRAKRLYVEHLIFALHSQAFAYVALTLALLVPRQTPALPLVVTVLLVVYLFAAMRAVYRQGTWKTLFKFGWLAFNYLLLLAAALVATAGIALVRA